MTTSMADCSGTPFNFQPEYNTAKAGNINPWGADQVNISTEFETGHWEACTSLSDPIAPTRSTRTTRSPVYNQCNGPYENAGPPDANTPEVGEALCFYAGATHPGYAGVGTSTQPRQDDRLPGRHLPERRPRLRRDPVLDGMAHRSHADTCYPSSSWNCSRPRTASQYSQFFFQTDVALSESTCGGNTLTTAPPGTSSRLAAPCRLRGRAGSTRTGARSSGRHLLARVRQRVRRADHLRQGHAVRDRPVRYVRLPAVHRGRRTTTPAATVIGGLAQERALSPLG